MKKSSKKKLKPQDPVPDLQDFSDDYSPQRLPEEFKNDKSYLNNLNNISNAQPVNIQVSQG